MPRPRIRFRLSTMLWIVLAVACWFGGMKAERWRMERERRTAWTMGDLLEEQRRLMESLEQQSAMYRRLTRQPNELPDE